MENVVERMVILTEDHEIQLLDLPERMRAQPQAKTCFEAHLQIGDQGICLKDTLDDLETGSFWKRWKKPEASRTRQPSCLV